VPGSNEVSDVWFVLGMGYDDKNNWDKAIEAFDKAIESKRDNHKAKFQRGQAYFKKGDMTHAKRDLEDFSKSGGASLEFAKQQAQKMLMDIAAKSAGADKPPELKSPEDLVKDKKGGAKGGKGEGVARRSREEEGQEVAARSARARPETYRSWARPHRTR
jgi:tetratricopeptide (TPR) repeat protein